MVDGGYCGRWVCHLNDKLGVRLVVKLKHDHLLGLVDVPEYTVALLAKRARRNDTGNMRPQGTKPFDVRSDFGVHMHRFDVLKWNLQTALQSPQLVPTFHLNDQLLFCDGYFSHTLCG